ncbi:hypothetical protein SAMD00023353_1002520 [Rosellinia necatrix]|uniref:GrpB domain protein n=1 Tax=Rosellinia necatrix TaxID=77044 RepID=A0A1W2TBH5_ROSNE|nr:hypothetical protein SAMD00023353_1002520 [Rosellinia necatrix]
MASALEVTTILEADEKDVEVISTRPQKPLEIVEYNPEWPAQYAEVEARIRRALRNGDDDDDGDGNGVVLEVTHVGSTSVPGLPAKDVIDVDLVVADPGDEASYAPALGAAGFRFLLREPAWYRHRLFYLPEPYYVNLHVFGPESPELARHRLFRDWLRGHPDDRARYAAAKRDAARAAAAAGERVQQYNLRKEPVLREILHRVFEAHGLLTPST